MASNGTDKTTQLQEDSNVGVSDDYRWTINNGLIIGQRLRLFHSDLCQDSLDYPFHGHQWDWETNHLQEDSNVGVSNDYRWTINHGLIIGQRLRLFYSVLCQDSLDYPFHGHKWDWETNHLQEDSNVGVCNDYRWTINLGLINDQRLRLFYSDFCQDFIDYPFHGNKWDWETNHLQEDSNVGVSNDYRWTINHGLIIGQTFLITVKNR